MPLITTPEQLIELLESYGFRFEKPYVNFPEEGIQTENISLDIDVYGGEAGLGIHDDDDLKISAIGLVQASTIRFDPPKSDWPHHPQWQLGVQAIKFLKGGLEGIIFHPSEKVDLHIESIEVKCFDTGAIYVYSRGEEHEGLVQFVCQSVNYEVEERGSN